MLVLVSFLGLIVCALGQTNIVQPPTLSGPGLISLPDTNNIQIAPPGYSSSQNIQVTPRQISSK